MSQIGLEKIFTAQEKQFGEQDGMLFCPWLGIKRCLMMNHVAPIVEIIYGTFTEQILGMATWILVPQ